LPSQKSPPETSSEKTNEIIAPLSIHLHFGILNARPAIGLPTTHDNTIDLDAQ
jgi:hypothetical protein